MAVRTFNKAVGELIALRLIGDLAISNEDGIRIKPDIESGDCTQILSWTPACEMEGWPDAPDALTHPSLPYPFSAKELAAFLLAGAGSLVAEYYGYFSDGPDEDKLQALGIKAGHARDALRQAYLEIRRAIAEVGEVDQQLQQKAHALRQQFNEANLEANEREGLWVPGISEDERRVRRERARQSVKELEVETDSVGRRADSALKHWNAAMVKALLYSTAELKDSAALPAPIAEPAPAQPDKGKAEQDAETEPQPVPVVQTEAVMVVAQAVPVVAHKDSDAKFAAKVDRSWVMKREAMFKKHERKWTSIRRDFQDANENGLSRAAKAPEHGNWFENDALDWARQRGKLNEETGQPAPSPATPFSGLTHRI